MVPPSETKKVQSTYKAIRRPSRTQPQEPTSNCRSLNHVVRVSQSRIDSHMRGVFIDRDLGGNTQIIIFQLQPNAVSRQEQFIVHSEYEVSEQ
jgi:hypothetical protein